MEMLEPYLENFRVQNHFSNLIVWLLTLLFWCLIFHKSGEPFWKPLIPFYGTYCRFKLAGIPKSFWTCLITSILCIGGFFATVIFLFKASIDILIHPDSIPVGVFVSLFISLLAFIIDCVVCCKMLYRTGKVMGAGTLFSIGLVLFPVIFLGIIALKKDYYYQGGPVVTATSKTKNLGRQGGLYDPSSTFELFQGNYMGDVSQTNFYGKNGQNAASSMMNNLYYGQSVQTPLPKEFMRQSIPDGDIPELE